MLVIGREATNVYFVQGAPEDTYSLPLFSGAAFSFFFFAEANFSKTGLSLSFC